MRAGWNVEDWQVRDRRMNIFAKDVPLSNLMNSIARVMKFKWSKSGDDNAPIYRLYMDRQVLLGGERQRFIEEEKVRERQTEARQKFMSCLEEAAGMSEDELQKLKVKSPYIYRMTKNGWAGVFASLCAEVPKAKQAWLSGQELVLNMRSLSPTVQQSLMKLQHGLDQEMIDKGKFNLPTDEAPVTLRQFAETWMAGHVEKNLRPSTYDGYAHQLRRHILPALGHRPLAEITRIEVKEFAYRKIEEGLSGVSVRDYMRCLSSIMNHAKEDGLRTDNPAEKPGRFVKAGRPGENAGFLTPEESRQFLISMATHFPADVPLLLTFLRTGLRRG
jgi:hypothetical protein